MSLLAAPGRHRVDMEQRVERAKTGDGADDQQHCNDREHNLPDAGETEKAEQEHQQTDAEANVAIKDAFIDRQHDVPLPGCCRLAVTLCGSSQRTDGFSIHILTEVL